MKWAACNNTSFVILSFVLLLQSGPVSACFDPTNKKCKGTTPRVDPELYYCMIRENLKHKLNSEVFVRFVDKLLFKEYCRSKNVPTPKTLAVYKQADYKKVDLDKFLPSYVLKSNKASARVIVVKNNTVMGKNGGPLDEKMKKRLKVIMSRWGRPADIREESFYDFAEPKIFIEEFLDPLPDDIKVSVVNNQVDMIRITSGHAMSMYDADMNRLPYVFKNYSEISRPSVADKLKSDPEKLTELHSLALKMTGEVPLDLVRADFYLVGETFYGSELTMSTAGGHDVIHHYDAISLDTDFKVGRPCINATF